MIKIKNDISQSKKKKNYTIQGFDFIFSIILHKNNYKVQIWQIVFYIFLYFLCLEVGINRLKKELQDITREPVEGIAAMADPKNIFEWHFLVKGFFFNNFFVLTYHRPEKTDYEGGSYYGILTFPSNYPFSAPGFLQ
jgi:hypothetical protein